MSLEEAAGLLRSPKGDIFWRALSADHPNGTQEEHHKVLSEIAAKGDAFVKSSEVWDREELVSQLRAIVSSETGGSLCLVLGGKSLGKSLILHYLQSENKGSVLADLRENSKDLLGVIHKAFDSTAGLWDRLRDGIKSVASAVAESQMPGTGQMAEGATGLAGSLLFKSSFAAISAWASNPGPRPTLMLDEANLAFSQRDPQDSLQLLELLTCLTKQKQKINVLFVSSDHSLLFQLAQLGFNLTNLTKLFFVGEVPPAAMLTLLRERFGMGPQLAATFATHYGGNVLLAAHAAKELDHLRERFRPNCVLSATVGSHVVQALDEERARPSELKGVTAILRQLVETGFAPVLKYGDPRVELLAKLGLAGLVPRDNSYIIGLDPSVWDRRCVRRESLGLVPIAHAARLQIADALDAFTPTDSK